MHGPKEKQDDACFDPVPTLIDEHRRGRKNDREQKLEDKALITYPSQVKETARGNHDGVVVILVRDVNHVLDPALNDELGAFVAGEEGHVHATACCEGMRGGGRERGRGLGREGQINIGRGEGRLLFEQSGQSGRTHLSRQKVKHTKKREHFF